MDSWATRDVLKAIGFEEDWNAMADKLPGYKFCSGNLRLTAAEVMSRYFRPIMYIGGYASDHRSVREICFEMPLAVESYEQGVAWIVSGIGDNFIPQSPIAWFSCGKEWEDQLPWIREMNAYKARPQCMVDREWFRVAVKKLRDLISTADETDMASFRFDGVGLQINVCGTTLVMPASGKAWDEPYTVLAKSLDFLPKRLTKESIHISSWNGHLEIDRRQFRLAHLEAAGEEGIA